jgi:hypothetical protein
MGSFFENNYMVEEINEALRHCKEITFTFWACSFILFLRCKIVK